jgi:hypothetical protein
MAIAVAESYPGVYVFPVTQGLSLPEIGQGFDLVGSNAIAVKALAGGAALNKSELLGGQGQYFSIYDQNSFQDAVEFDASTSGGGWGVQSGMCLSASARVTATSTSFTIQFNGAKTTSQAIVDPSAALSGPAADYLQKNGPEKFIETYGTHFVAGYIYGKSCKATYSLRFSSLDTMTKFSAKFNESTSEVGFNDQTNASITNTLTTTSTSASITASQNSLGFDAPSVSTLDDLKNLIVVYDAEASANSAISILVMPWQYLDAVQEAFADIDCNDIASVNRMINGLIYISSTAEDFIDRSLYTGNTQLEAVRDVGTRASDQTQAMVDLVSTAVASHVPVKVQNGKQLTINGMAFPYTQAMTDDLNFAMDHFVLSWKAWVGPGSQPLSTPLVGLDGGPIPVSSDRASVDGSGGTYFTWSIEGNGGWAGTAGTQSMSYTLAAFPDAWNMAIILDSKAGTLQCVGRGVGQSLDQNPRSKTLQIRGNSNARPCTDPKNTAVISCNLQGGNYLISPM